MRAVFKYRQLELMEEMGDGATVSSLLSTSSGAVSTTSGSAGPSANGVSDIQVSTILNRDQLSISSADVTDQANDITVRSPSPLDMEPPSSLPATIRAEEISLPPPFNIKKQTIFELGIQPISSSSRSSSPSSDDSFSLRSSRGSSATLTASSPRLRPKNTSPEYIDQITEEVNNFEEILPQSRSPPTDISHAPPSTGSSESSTRAPNTPIDAPRKLAVDIAARQIRRKTDKLYRQLGPRHLEYDYALAKTNFSAVFVQALSDNGYVVPIRKTKKDSSSSSSGPSQEIVELAKQDWRVKKAAQALNKADNELEAALSRGEFWENTPPPPEMCWGAEELRDLEWARLPPQEVPEVEEEQPVEVRRSQRIRRPRDLSLLASELYRKERRSSSREKTAEGKFSRGKRRAVSSDYEVSDSSEATNSRKRRRKV